MSAKKVLAIAVAAAVTLTVGASAVFAGGMMRGKAGVDGKPQRGGEQPVLTEEQRAEFEAKMGEKAPEMKEAPELTEEQKAVLIEIADARLVLELNAIDKQVAVGLIDAERAEEMKTAMQESHAKMKEDGNVPMQQVGMGGRAGRAGMGGMRTRGGMGMGRRGERPAFECEEGAEGV